MTGIKKKDILGKGGYQHAILFYGEPRPTLVNFVLRRDARWEKGYIDLKEEDGMLMAADSFHPIMGDGGKYLSATAAPLYDAKDNIIGAIQSMRDVTDAKRLEQERESLIQELTAHSGIRFFPNAGTDRVSTIVDRCV